MIAINRQRAIVEKSFHSILEQPDSHKSESIVRYVADLSDLDIDLGIKGRSGILQSIETRESFLSEPIPLDRLSLYADTRFLDEPGRNMV